MNSFTVLLHSAMRSETFEHITRFVGADSTGCFGIHPGHARFVSVLRYGLARFQDTAGSWRFVTLPGGVLSFEGATLSIVTAQYFIGPDSHSLEQRLRAEMQREDSDLHATRSAMSAIDESLTRRLATLASNGPLAEGR